MNEHDIRETIERLLGKNQGALYSASQSAQRNKSGDAAFLALAEAARADIEAAANSAKGDHGAAC